MQLRTFRVPGSGPMRVRNRGIWLTVFAVAIVTIMLSLAGLGQMAQDSSRPAGPWLPPEANRMPDKNEQMIMRQQTVQRHNFDAANATRLKQMVQASEALETLAMALKAEVDKSEDLSQNEVNKAETIEKLARIVKERMKLTVATN